MRHYPVGRMSNGIIANVDAVWWAKLRNATKVKALGVNISFLPRDGFGVCEDVFQGGTDRRASRADHVANMNDAEASCWMIALANYHDIITLYSGSQLSTDELWDRGMPMGSPLLAFDCRV